MVWVSLTNQLPIGFPAWDLDCRFYQPFTLKAKASQTFDKKHGLRLESQLSSSLLVDFIRVTTEQKEGVFALISTIDQFSVMFVLPAHLDLIFDHFQLVFGVQNLEGTELGHEWARD